MEFTLPDRPGADGNHQHILTAETAPGNRGIGSAWDVGCEPEEATPAGPDLILPEHWAEMEASGIAPDVAAANVASFGPGTPRHWELEREAVTRHKREGLANAPRTPRNKAWHGRSSGTWQTSKWGLDRPYRHLEHGGWRTLSDVLLGIPVFAQWKPDHPRTGKKGKPVKYEAPAGFPDGGGLLLPRVPERIWRRICERHQISFPDAATVAAGFWPWALATPSLPLLICEGWKKALAALTAGHAAVALPGVSMGHRCNLDGTRRLIPGLEALAPGRALTIAFDADRKRSTRSKVGKAAGALAGCLRKAGAKPSVCRLPLLPGADKTGLDDLWVAGGPEALDRALADLGPLPVLPHLRAADRIAPAGEWLGVSCPIPSPEEAPLVVICAPMGAGKTRAIEAALRPLQRDGVPILLPSHRIALGQALAERVGIPWEAKPGTDERLQGVAACLDSWCPDSALQITGQTGSGGVLVLDEWAQQAEHLLTGMGTALADGDRPRRAAVFRTLAEQLSRARQVIAADGQMPQWAVDLLEALTGRRALLICSEHAPMHGRRLHCPAGFTTAVEAGKAFRAKVDQIIRTLKAGRSLLVWSSAQKGDESINAPENLAARHRQIRPSDVVDVIDSTTPDLAAELAADPDGFAERRIAEAAARGGAWVLYVSPAVSSGISFERWKPAAVIAYSGGQIAPEHVAQALARVRCPEVPAWLFAPERSPGKGLRVGSGATDPAALIAALRKTPDRLFGLLQESGPEEAWLKAWAALGAHRNRQHFAYRATAAGLLEREGWELQAPGPEHCPTIADTVTAELRAIRDGKREAKRQAILTAEPLTALEAAKLDRRRSLEPSEAASLARYRLAQALGLEATAPLSGEMLEAAADGLLDRLRLGWLLTTPEAMALVPKHDWLAVNRLDFHGQPFAPDRVRVTLAPAVAALQALGIPALLARFAGGEVIAANDPAVLALHATATAHRGQLKVCLDLSPGELPTGTLRTLLKAVGWRLERAGRIHTRGDDRGVCTYTAQRVALPEGVDPEALAAKWMAELREGGAKNDLSQKTGMRRICAIAPHRPPSPILQTWPLVPVVAIPWHSPPPRPHPKGFAVAC